MRALGFAVAILVVAGCNTVLPQQPSGGPPGPSGALPPDKWVIPSPYPEGTCQSYPIPSPVPPLATMTLTYGGKTYTYDQAEGALGESYDGKVYLDVRSTRRNTFASQSFVVATPPPPADQEVLYLSVPLQGLVPQTAEGNLTLAITDKTCHTQYLIVGPAPVTVQSLTVQQTTTVEDGRKRYDFSATGQAAGSDVQGRPYSLTFSVGPSPTP